MCWGGVLNVTIGVGFGFHKEACVACLCVSHLAVLCRIKLPLQRKPRMIDGAP